MVYPASQGSPLYNIPSIILDGHLRLSRGPVFVVALDPEPVAAFFGSTSYSLDSLLERAALHPHRLQ